jgi:microcystin-dependent protein
VSGFYLGEIRLFPYNFAPRGWANCDGQLMAIAQNTALFSLLGTTYGGNGQTTFALPDLRGRVAMHGGNGAGPGLTQRFLGEVSGTETTTLNANQMPAHAHPYTPNATAAASSKTPTGHVPAATVAGSIYGDPGALAMAPGTTGAAGGGQPFDNLQPYLVLAYCIALQGIFPSRN